MIAIVPARGGSKGLPGKNIRLFCGKPLIFYTISEALKSKNISDVIVSTDSSDIAHIAESFGAKCLFLRPLELAGDNSKAIDNYLYTVKRLNDEFGYKIQEFMVLQPTSPLRTSMDIDNASSLFYEKMADSVISVTEFIHPPQWAKVIDNSGKIRNYFENDMSGINNRQEFLKAYIPNGAIYIFQLSLLERTYSYYSNNTYGYVMEQQKSVDIDNISDFEYAEFLMRKTNG